MYKKSLLLFFIICILNGCSTPSYYSYKGSSENWSGSLDFEVDESVSEAKVKLQLTYIGSSQPDKENFSYKINLPDHSEVIYTKMFSGEKANSIENEYDQIHFPQKIKDQYEVEIFVGNKVEVLVLVKKD